MLEDNEALSRHVTLPERDMSEGEANARDAQTPLSLFEQLLAANGHLRPRT